jgi:cyclopropane-fatty-acyl-phospholipid synthase
MSQHELTDTGMDHRPRRRFSVREAIIVRALSRAFNSGSVTGRLRLTLPSGRTEVFGRGGEEAHVILRSFQPLWRGLTRGALGVAECYFDGSVDSPHLGSALRFGLANTKAVGDIGGGVMRARSSDRRWHRRRANTRAGSKANIKAHYDLGNAFYQLWLDPSMTYSSALFSGPNDCLQAAQHAKNKLIVESLGVEPGHQVLEIGCGWGGFAEAAARAGAHVKGITLSREQLEFAQARLQAAGLEDRTQIAFVDYRDVTESYDRIASIEMVEAVGEENWPTYFQAVHDRLKAGGVAVIQAITIDERHFDSYRREPDFIQRYIFPGGMLPTVSAMQEHAAAAGLTFETVERFGSSYARTLAIWRAAFLQSWPQVAAQGFDERFRRMWEYYLTYCEVGFESGDVDVGIYRLTRA